MSDPSPWYIAIWAVVDNALRGWSKSLQRMLGLLRLARALLVVGLVAILLSALVGILAGLGRLDIRWFLYTHAFATLFLVIPLVALVVLVGLPLRARSVTRLVDMGYPANARELAIRVLARKLRDESIETEELLVETAVNEARKAMRRLEQKRDEPPSPAGNPPPPPL